MECSGCSGSLDPQHRLFHRGSIRRSPEAVKRDLVALSQDAGLRYVNSCHDFLRFASPVEKEFVFDRKYALALYYDFFDTPSAEDIDRLLACFEGGMFTFSMDDAHGSSTHLTNKEELAARIRHVRNHSNFHVRLSYMKQGVLQDRRYREAFEYVIRETRCETHQADWWFESFNPQPDENGCCSDATYARCLENADRYYLFNRLYRMFFLCHYISPSWVRQVLYTYNRLVRSASF